MKTEEMVFQSTLAGGLVVAQVSLQVHATKARTEAGNGRDEGQRRNSNLGGRYECLPTLYYLPLGRQLPMAQHTQTLFRARLGRSAPGDPGISTGVKGYEYRYGSSALEQIVPYH